jgi:hypothetical protein
MMYTFILLPFQNGNLFEQKKLNCHLISFQWPFLKKNKNSNTWFINGNDFMAKHNNK